MSYYKWKQNYFYVWPNMLTKNLTLLIPSNRDLIIFAVWTQIRLFDGLVIIFQEFFEIVNLLKKIDKAT